MPEIIHFVQIYGIHVLIFIFSSINSASRILILNLILMVLNLFCCILLCIYLRLSISVSKSCHIIINIFWIACIQRDVVPKLFLIFWQSETHYHTTRLDGYRSQVCPSILLPKINFRNRAKVRMTHFKISVTVYTTGIINK